MPFPLGSTLVGFTPHSGLMIALSVPPPSCDFSFMASVLELRSYKVFNSVNCLAGFLKIIFQHIMVHCGYGFCDQLSNFTGCRIFRRVWCVRRDRRVITTSASYCYFCKSQLFQQDRRVAAMSARLAKSASSASFSYFGVLVISASSP